MMKFPLYGKSYSKFHVPNHQPDNQLQCIYMYIYIYALQGTFLNKPETLHCIYYIILYKCRLVRNLKHAYSWNWCLPYVPCYYLQWSLCVAVLAGVIQNGPVHLAMGIISRIFWEASQYIPVSKWGTVYHYATISLKLEIQNEKPVDVDWGVSYKPTPQI